MKINILENKSMSGEDILVPTTVEKAIRLTGFSRNKVERLIRENGLLPVHNCVSVEEDYWFVLVEDNR